jgi:hypothetical protein
VTTDLIEGIEIEAFGVVPPELMELLPESIIGRLWYSLPPRSPYSPSLAAKLKHSEI